MSCKYKSRHVRCIPGNENDGLKRCERLRFKILSFIVLLHTSMCLHQIWQYRTDLPDTDVAIVPS